MVILLDTNIILDLALQRQPYFEEAIAIFKLIDKSNIRACVTASSITDIYYIVKKSKSHNEAIAIVKNIIQYFEIISVDKEIIVRALESSMKDFEDAIQSFAALSENIDYIVTRNIKDFENSKVLAISPQEFLLIA